MSEGVVIDQRFKLGRVVRESGVAIVYEAMHRNGASAWIKLPRAPEHAAALLTEAKVANALGKNAVSVRDDGYTDEGAPYLVLEPTTGQRLDHWRSASGGRAPPDEAMGLGDELCQAIGTMHAAGYSVGLLRTDAIIVLPEGGMCLLELEHAQAASEDSVKEDVVRVGRVLYEMLSGMPCLGASPPLHEAAPELPRAMTSTVDDAARGRYTTIEDLRRALRVSRPDWLGPMRRPMPSLPPTEDGGFDAASAWPEAAARRSSAPGPLFDPRDLIGSPELVESRRAMDVPPAPALSGVAVSAEPTRGSTPSELDAPPVAAFHGEKPALRFAPRVRALLYVGAAACVLIAAVLVLGVVVAAMKGDEPRAAVAAAASSVAEPSAKNAPAKNAPAASSVAVSGDVIELDDAPAAPGATPPGTASVAAPPSAGVAPPGESPASEPASPASEPASSASEAPSSGEARLRFEGDLSPRLVIIDGVAIGVTTKSVSVRCGRRIVKIGGKGASRPLDLPCDGEQGITIERNGSWRAE